MAARLTPPPGPPTVRTTKRTSARAPARPAVPSSDRVRGVLGRVLATLAAGGLLAGSAVVFAASLAPSLHSRYLPWITGRSLGIASYACLWALVGLGMAMRHPWRAKVRFPHPESLLRAHAMLGTATVTLVLAHVVFLASDRYAGVGWLGALVPGMSHYRTGAIALGVVSLLLLLVIAATARFAGRRGARHWLAFHRLSAVTFVLVWLHGVLAGTDTAALRLLYLATGTALLVVAGTRALASTRGERIGDAP